jgi:purine-binding chemotaxis protein CheW
VFATLRREDRAAVNAPVPLLVFQVGMQAFALPLPAVRCVVAAVALTPLPGAPEPVLGFFDLRGLLVPVLDAFARGRAGLQRIRADQQFVVADTGHRVVAVVADAVRGVQAAVPESLPDMAATPAQPGVFAAVTRMADGLVLIHDVERFLTEADAAALDALLAPARALPASKETLA